MKELFIVYIKGKGLRVIDYEKREANQVNIDKDRDGEIT